VIKVIINEEVHSISHLDIVGLIFFINGPPWVTNESPKISKPLMPHGTLGEVSTVTSFYDLKLFSRLLKAFK
jgi:hypothetical protein